MFDEDTIAGFERTEGTGTQTVSAPAFEMCCHAALLKTHSAVVLLVHHNVGVNGLKGVWPQTRPVRLLTFFLFFPLFRVSQSTTRHSTSYSQTFRRVKTWYTVCRHKGKGRCVTQWMSHIKLKVCLFLLHPQRTSVPCRRKCPTMEDCTSPTPMPVFTLPFCSKTRR